MPDFHVGDRVRVTLPGTTDQAFEITEVKEFSGKPCYTGAGRLWWGAENLDYDLTDAQREVLVKFEKAVHAYRTAESELDQVQLDADYHLPAPLVDRILDKEK